MTEQTIGELARRLDLLAAQPRLTRKELETICATARRANVFSVAVASAYVELTRALLEESSVQVTALVGYPLGTSDSDAKRYETEIAVDNGAQEIDLVINLGWLKEGEHRRVLRELRDVVEAADERPVKAILETQWLTPEEQMLACHLALDSGVQFVGNSTDFNASPASPEDIRRLRAAVGEKFGVKAAGGVTHLDQVRELLDAGATRVGVHAEAHLLTAPVGQN